MATLASWADLHARDARRAPGRLGAETLATAIAIGVNPAKSPWTTRDHEQLLDRPDEAHGRDDQRERGQRADEHELAAEAVGQAAEERTEHARHRRRDGRQHAGPQRDAAGVGDPELAHVQRHERRRELEADEGDEDAERQGPDVAAPGLERDQSPRQ